MAGTTVTLTMKYFYDAPNSEYAMQFFVQDGAVSTNSPVEDWSGNLSGDIVGGYYQIGNGNTAPGASGQAVFGNIVGTATDHQGAAVPNANVTVTSQTKNT